MVPAPLDMGGDGAKQPDRRMSKGSQGSLRRSVSELPDTSTGAKYPRLAAFVRSVAFESCVGLAILVNSITIGISVNAVLHEQPTWVQVSSAISEHVFTAIFLAEFFLKAIFYGWQIYNPFCPGKQTTRMDACWNVLDALLVWISGVFLVWIAPFAGLDVDQLRILTLFRAVRLMRLIRVVKKMPQFSEVYLLVRGLSDSMQTLFWTVLVLFFITYVFSIFGVVLISVPVQKIYEDTLTGTSQDFKVAELEFLWEHIGSLDGWLYTLIQVLTLDSWTGISRPLEHVLPGGSWWFFVLYVVLASIVFLNLVTAVIVEKAMENSKADEESQLLLKEEASKKLFTSFQALFIQLDENESGTVTADEFDKAFHTPEVATKLQLLDFKQEDCLQLFELLDEGDGSLTLDEFFDGMSHMKGEASAKEVFILSKTVDKIWHFLLQLSHEVDGDAKSFFKAQGMESQRPPRESSILARSKKAAREAAEAKSRPSEDVTVVNVALGGKNGNKDDPYSYDDEEAEGMPTNMSTPELAAHIRGLVNHIGKATTNLNSQMENLTARLAAVDESTALANNLVQQFIGPSETKLRVKDGQSLGRCCAT